MTSSPPTPTSAPTVPPEILSIIISHIYSTPWSLYILDRTLHGSLPIDGLPPLTPTLHLSSRLLRHLATTHERGQFTGSLIFTTSSTQWRILSRIRTTSPTRLGWVLDHVTTLTFCSPPLFTNRVPWSALPNLRKVELDYCYRAANFRCEGKLEDLERGFLDPMILNFARDTERFDGPLVEDAWRASRDMDVAAVTGEDEGLSSPASAASSGGANDSSSGLSSNSSDEELVPDLTPPKTDPQQNRQIEVDVIKRMLIFESPAPRYNTAMFANALSPAQEEALIDPTNLAAASHVRPDREKWSIKVVARHKGRIESVSYEVVDGYHEVPEDLRGKEGVVWTVENGFREASGAGMVKGRVLKVRNNDEREKYVVDK